MVRELASKSLLEYVSSSQPASVQRMEPLLKYVDAGGTEGLGGADSAVGLVRDFFRVRQLLEHQEKEEKRIEAAVLLRAMLDPLRCTPFVGLFAGVC